VSFVLDPYRHLAQAVDQASFAENGPPAVQEHFERARHRSPTTSEKPLAQQGGEATIADVPDEIAERQRPGEERQLD
jgi:hypothetical protein